ncbi:MAG: DUF1573 domain-containing protein [Mongoliibacter sp.]|uniref:DUF1573 domain-containing protein n=1 Tax=Mongoliibacter sp. TaxID=2022438 RepID=UPI0012F0E69B|nr:DUF1573 domain-containing protein [Mongoliibacter sp.]TVP45250.1 MAG: DUF1573 domain-containing protein [Mongoliibacter sp.]
MKKSLISGTLCALFVFISLSLEAQTIDRKVLTWEQRNVNIGAVLEERGEVEAEFFGVNLNQDTIWITDVYAECGCTAVSFSRDTLFQDKIGSLKVKFNPDHRGGAFAKQIIVRTNQDIYGDTLILEGINIPVPDNIQLAYKHRIGDLGFRLSAINMGEVFTNEPKLKHVEVYNFGNDTLKLKSEQKDLPEHLYVALEPESILPGQRGLLLLSYDGDKKADLGYFEENVSLQLQNENEIEMKLTAVVYEFFQPVPKSMEKVVPRLGLSEIDIDLRDVAANRKVSRDIVITNMGEEMLQIRKIATNCDCVEVLLGADEIGPGQKTELRFTFDTKGRKGIDHKHITIFSNDPIYPVRTVVVKSTIK